MNNEVDMQQVQSFASTYHRLRDYADKLLIDELTEIARVNVTNIPTAYHLVTVILSRILDITTPTAYKLPILYLIDSIMKNVGGPYAAFFAKNNKVAEAYCNAYNETTVEVKKKMITLLDASWSAKDVKGRSILPMDVLAMMRNHIATHPIQATHISTVPQALQHQTIASTNVYAGNNQQYNQLQQQQQQQQQQHNPPYIAPPNTRKRPPQMPLQPPPQLTTIHHQQQQQLQQYNHKQLSPQVLVNEMESLLRELYAGMPNQPIISLDDIQRVNPPLYAQLQTAAEMNLQAAGYTYDAMVTDTIETYYEDVTSDDNYFIGYVNRSKIAFNKQRLSHLNETLTHISNSNNNKLSAISKKLTLISSNLLEFLENVPPSSSSSSSCMSILPTTVTGVIPIEPSKEWIAYTSAVPSSLSVNKPVIKAPIPPFRVDKLNETPQKILQALYNDRPHQYHEDGVRFKHRYELLNHYNGALAKKEIQRKKEANGERVCRMWYCTVSQWVSNFNGFDKKDASNPRANSTGVGGSDNYNKNKLDDDGNALDDKTDKDGALVLADEHYTRCPISKEVFEQIWDDDEATFFFKNAAKVYLPESMIASNDHIYKLSQQTSQSDVKYIIVHKKLVMDGWVDNGKCTKLNKAIARYAAMGKTKDNDAMIAHLISVADYDNESHEDVYVLIS